MAPTNRSPSPVVPATAAPTMSGAGSDSDPDVVMVHMPLPPAPSATAPTGPPPPPDVIMYIVHGMGRQSWLPVNVAAVQSTLAELAEDPRLTSPATANDGTPGPTSRRHVAIVPVEYHSRVHARTRETVDAIRLQSCPALRVAINDFAVDPLYYFSAENGQFIRTQVVRQINEHYQRFTASHPTFSGEVTVLAHSMGGLVMYDIMNARPGGSPGIPPATVQLLPPIKRVFCVGSPISNALVLRGHHGALAREYYAPSARFFNIYHPLDPIAYRLEPLYDPAWQHTAPVSVDTYVPPTTAGGEALHWRLLGSIAARVPAVPTLPPLPIPGIPDVVSRGVRAIMATMRGVTYPTGPGGGVFLVGNGDADADMTTTASEEEVEDDGYLTDNEAEDGDSREVSDMELDDAVVPSPHGPAPSARAPRRKRTEAAAAAGKSRSESARFGVSTSDGSPASVVTVSQRLVARPRVVRQGLRHGPFNPKTDSPASATEPSDNDSSSALQAGEARATRKRRRVELESGKSQAHNVQNGESNFAGAKDCDLAPNGNDMNDACAYSSDSNMSTAEEAAAVVMVSDRGRSPSIQDAVGALAATFWAMVGGTSPSVTAVTTVTTTGDGLSESPLRSRSPPPREPVSATGWSSWLASPVDAIGAPADPFSFAVPPAIAALGVTDGNDDDGYHRSQATAVPEPKPAVVAPVEAIASEVASPSPPLESLLGGHRLDYCLPMGPAPPGSGRIPRVDAVHEYLRAMRAHFDYWRSRDALWFILCELNGGSMDDASIAAPTLDDAIIGAASASSPARVSVESVDGVAGGVSVVQRADSRIGS